MATIIVEDGTIVAGANSYVTEAELTTYATDRGKTLSGSTDVLLIQAMDFIESQNFIGVKSEEDQPLQWPRDWVQIDGYFLDDGTIPQELKNAQMAAAIAIDDGNGPLDDIPRSVKREKIDVIEVEYMDNAASQVINRKIQAALRKLLKASGGFQVVRA